MPHLPDRSLRNALAISTAFHLMLAPLFATSVVVALGTADRSRGTGAAETTSIAYLSIEHRARQPVHAAVVAHLNASPPRTSTPLPARHQPQLARPTARNSKPVATVALAHTNAVSTAHPRMSGALGRIVVSLATAGPERASQSAAQRVETPEPTRPAAHDTAAAAAPQPSPTVAPDVADAAPRGMDSPPGGWGQSFDKPLVADETALADLRSRYHARSAVTVEVDEAGHATRIVLPNGLSEDMRAELERRLRDLRYVPAECNGLRCGGTLQILI